MSYQMPAYYAAPVGTPLYWADETSGKLKEAVEAYLRRGAAGAGNPTDEHLMILKAYILHWLAAPCWEAAGAVAGGDAALKLLKHWRAAAERIHNWNDVEKMIGKMMSVGIDPL